MPSRVPNSGTPRMKLWVPSMGSMYQRVRAVAVLGAVLLPHQAVVRVAGADPLADDPLDALVRDRHEGPVRLALEVEVAPEVAEGDLVGGVARLEGEGEPLAQGGLGDAGEGGGPGGSEVGLGHDHMMPGQ